MYREAMAISEAGPVPGHAAISPPRSYGDSLAREGRAAEALPFLEAAIVKPQQRGGAESWLRHAQGALGDAYDQLGRTDEARKMLSAARDGWVRYGPQGGTQALGARERWARFLLDHGETGPAVAEFNDVVRIAGETPSAPAAMAEAGLARAALAGGDKAGADAASARAMRTLDLVTLEYDFRTRPDVWMVRAEVLLAVGRKADAASLADRALRAAWEYDAPGSGRVARAQDLVRRVAA
jgi:serine/threonine-protein kinase